MDTSASHQAPDHAAEDFLDTLGSSSADGVYAVDDEQRIVYWSRAAEVLTGRTAAEVSGRRCFEVMLGDDEEGNPFCRRNCPTIAAARRGRPVPSYDISTPTGDGRRAWFNVSIVVLPGKRRRELRAAHMFRDVTARRRAEAFAEATVPPPSVLVPAPAQRRRMRRSAAAELAVKLTTRELEVLRLLGQGLSTDAMACRLNLSKATVRNHMDRLRTKLGAHSRIEALVRAGQLGIA
ncbi:MAG: PAS domain S-box protein [Chloroflexi bacterium]|nr:PAS domain S-box protein [Chloroflexota bacterium]